MTLKNKNEIIETLANILKPVWGEDKEDRKLYAEHYLDTSLTNDITCDDDSFEVSGSYTMRGCPVVINLEWKK